eukprot:3570709-Rhodomonas_salina.1
MLRIQTLVPVRHAAHRVCPRRAVPLGRLGIRPSNAPEPLAALQGLALGSIKVRLGLKLPCRLRQALSVAHH